MKTIDTGKGNFALVDDEDFYLLDTYKWSTDAEGYAIRRYREEGKRKLQFMHKAVKPGFARLDHKDRNKQNNQKDNLRPASNSQNMANTGPKVNSKSGVKGVHWCARTNKWVAQIRIGGKKTFLGRYSDLASAGAVYKQAEIKEFGEFAYGYD